MNNVWENRVQDSNFKVWLINLLNEMKGDIIDEVKQIVSEKETPDVKKWIKSAQVKKLLDISHGKLQTMRDKKLIAYTRIGGTIYYNVEEIERMMKEKSE